MTHASLCTGIGGFDLAASWMGWENVFQCEIEPFCQHVLKYWFPQCELFSDMKTSDFTRYAGRIDIISAGFPCQPFSSSGRKQGTNDDRYLWPEVYRVIREVFPSWCIIENVYEILTIQRGLVFKEICNDLENFGYEVLQPFVIPACAVDEDHLRYRVWILANSTGKGLQRKMQRKTNMPSKPFRNKSTESHIRTRHDGFPIPMDGITFSDWRKQSLKAYGNSVVPQLVFEIFKVIEKVEQTLIQKNEF